VAAPTTLLRRLIRRLYSLETVRKAAIPLLNTLSLYLVLPFHPGVSIPALLGALGSGAIWLSGASKRRFRPASIFLFAASLMWAVLSPYFAPSGRIYLYQAGSLDPLRSRIISLGNATTGGHLVYLTDPIRASAPIRHLAKLLGFGAEFLERLRSPESSAIVMPLSDAIRYRVLGAGTPDYAEELITSYTGPKMSVGAFPTPKPGLSVEVGVAFANFELVDYIRNVSGSPDRPWESVVYGKEDERQAAVYAAKLDLALQVASRGDFQVAIGTLGSALNEAPTELEVARLYALQGFVSDAAVGGNVGVTQGLASFNQAMRHWPRAASGRHLFRSQLNDPIDRWLFDGLKVVFVERQDEYPTWSAILGNSELHARLRGSHRSGPIDRTWWFNQIPDTPVESLIYAERYRLIDTVRGCARDPVKLRAALKEFASDSPDRARWAFYVLLGAESQAMSTGIIRPARASPPAPEFRDALDELASMCPDPWKSRYRRLLSFWSAMTGDLATFAQNNDQQAIDTTVSIVKLIAGLGFPLTAQGVSNQIPKMEGTSRPEESPESLSEASNTHGPAVPWWNRRYLDWFGRLVVGLWGEGGCQLHSARCREALGALVSRCERDDQGKGRVFAPCLALVLIASRELSYPISGSWLTAYRDATGSEQAPRAEWR